MDFRLRRKHSVPKLAFIFLACLFFFLPGLSAEEPPHKLTAVDRGRIQIDSKQWLDLAGIEASHLTSKKKSPTVFNDEITRFLKGYGGKRGPARQRRHLGLARISHHQ